MDFPTIVSKVVLETNREDMGFSVDGGDDRIPNAVMASTLYLHCLDYFYKDIKEAQVIFDTAAYIQVLDLSTLPKYRNIAYFRKNDPTLSSYQQNPTILPPLFNNAGFIVGIETKESFLEPTSVTDILDDYGMEKLDIMYQAGNNLKMKSSTSLQYGLVGWYAYPNIQADAPTKTSYYDSWIAREQPQAIIFHASSAIFSSIGKQEQARKYDAPAAPPMNPGGLATQQIDLLMRMNVTLQGR